MQRQTIEQVIKKADGILTADWHLSETHPVCRTDDFVARQWIKVAFVRRLQELHGCPVFHAGDLFDYWKPSPELLSRCNEEMPAQFYSIYGNHDLPQHAYELRKKSGLYNLISSGTVKHWEGGGDWEVPTPKDAVAQEPGVSLKHIMTYDGKAPFPGCKDPKAAKVLKKDGSALVVTGHNHKPFVKRIKGNLLVNPGSLTRQTAADTFKPRVYLWYRDSNTVEAVYLPAPEGVVDRTHIDKKKDRAARIEAFIEKLTVEEVEEIDFEANLLQVLESNKTITKEVKSLLLQSINK